MNNILCCLLICLMLGCNETNNNDKEPVYHNLIRIRTSTGNIDYLNKAIQKAQFGNSYFIIHENGGYIAEYHDIIGYEFIGE